MDIYVLNKSLEKIGIIDEYTSLIWTKRYYTAGDFELYVPASVALFELLQEDFYLQRTDDDRAMIIETIQLQTDAEEGNYIIVSGRSVESILARRVIWNQTILNDTVENAIRQVITENCISPADTARKINGLELAAPSGFGEALQQQTRGDVISEWLETVCRTYGYGWKITINDGRFIFSIFKGTDRTYGNAAGNPFVVFSPDFDNLINSNYMKDKQSYKNTALILGEGEGTSRKSAVVGTAEDLERYEIYVDARDISSNNGAISEGEYNNLLSERGKQSIAEQAITTAFDGEIDGNGIYTYKKDFDIGDIVQIKNDYGIKAKSRIVEIIENDDESGRHIVPTLEKWEAQYIPAYLTAENGDILTTENGDFLEVE